MRGTALVTGAAKRIGREIALRLAEMGHNVAVHYHASAAAAKQTRAEIEAVGVRCELFRCDLSDTREAERLIPAVFEAFPDCNVLVNNASIFERGGVMDADEAMLERHWAVHFKAPLVLTRHFARRCRSGAIVNILDTKITRDFSAYFAYAVSKKALHELTRMAAKELAPGIRVNGVCPGLILPPAGKDQAYMERLAAKIPLRRPGRCEDVAAAVAFLVESEFVTGEVIRVDGGEHLL